MTTGVIKCILIRSFKPLKFSVTFPKLHSKVSPFFLDINYEIFQVGSGNASEKYTKLIELCGVLSYVGSTELYFMGY